MSLMTPAEVAGVTPAEVGVIRKNEIPSYHCSFIFLGVSVCRFFSYLKNSKINLQFKSKPIYSSTLRLEL